MRAALLIAAIVLAALPGCALPAAAYDAEIPAVTLELTDADIGDVIRSLMDEAGLNVVMDAALEGRVTARLKDVPFWDAVGTLLGSKGYTYQRLEGGLVIVRPLNPSEKEELGTVLGQYRLRYIEMSPSLLESVRELLSDKGRAVWAPGANSIVLKDYPLGVYRIEGLLASLDKRPEQVMIEARLVEMDTSYSKDLGISWTGSYSYASGNVFGGLGSVSTSFGVNLPSGTDEGLSLGLGLVADKVSLDARLSALEDTGAARVLSSPRVTVVENREAVITSGMDILVPSVEATTVIRTGDSDGPGLSEIKSEIFKARLELAVRPRIVEEDQLLLSVNTRREEFDFDRQIQGFPPKNTRSASTDLLVADGETIVIGGIYRESEDSVESGVPYLSRIPILGWLFKRKADRRGQSELLIFLTPTIVRRGGA